MNGNEGVALEYTRNRVQLYADSLAEMSRFCRGERKYQIVEDELEGKDTCRADEETVDMVQDLNQLDQEKESEKPGRRRNQEALEQVEERELVWEREKRKEERNLLGDYLADLSEHMQQMVGQAFVLSRYSGKEERRMKAALLKEKILVHEILIFHRGEEDFVGMKVSCRGMSGCEKGELAQRLSKLLKKEMIPADYTDSYIRGEIVTQIFWEKPRYFCTYGVARTMKTGEKISGDNFSVVERENGYVFGMLSDGMGCGEEAYEGSCEVLDYVEKLLEMGFSPKEAIRNSRRLFLLRGDNKSTLDLCVLNLNKGSGCFYKVGGGASFLKSGKYVEMISCPGLPLGIGGQQMGSLPDIESKERELVDGDYVVMMTDGVIDALEQEGYEEGMRDFLTREKERHPKELADHILQFAIDHCDGAIKDDMTVLVFRIWASH